MQYNNTALVDADYILWIACNANKVKTEYGTPLREQGKYVYSDKTLEEAITTCDGYIEDILNLTHADSFLLFLTTGETFRHKLDHSYKANRVGMAKPLWFYEVKAHMIEKWGAIEVEGLEADDLVLLAKAELSNSFIIAADKDILECIPGKHFDARKGRMQFIETDDKTAAKNFAISLLTGDKIDGIPNLLPGMGPKTAEKELAKYSEYPLVLAAAKVFIDYLGESEGLARFTRQYSLLKIIESKHHLPSYINLTLPEPLCFNCVESVLSNEMQKGWEYLLSPADDPETDL